MMEKCRKLVEWRYEYGIIEKPIGDGRHFRDQEEVRVTRKKFVCREHMEWVADKYRCEVYV